MLKQMRELPQTAELPHITECEGIPDDFFDHPDYCGKEFWNWEDYVGSYLVYYTDFKEVEWGRLPGNLRWMSCVLRTATGNVNLRFQYGD